MLGGWDAAGLNDLLLRDVSQGETAMWGRKRKTERLPWYRVPKYKGTVTEDQKRQLDAFRLQPKHPAAQADDLPDEVQSYINKLECEIHKLKTEASFNVAAASTALVAVILYISYDGAPSIWWLAAGVWLVWVWIDYYRRSKQADEEFLPSDDFEITDERIREEWEINYVVQHSGGNDRRHLNCLKLQADTIHQMLFANIADREGGARLLASVGSQVRRQMESRFGTDADQTVRVDTDDDLHQQGAFLDNLPLEQLSQLAESLYEQADRKLSEGSPAEQEGKETTLGIALLIISQWLKSKAIARSSTDTEFVEDVRKLEGCFYNYIRKLLRIE